MQENLVTSQDLLTQFPMFKTIWIAGTSFRSLTKSAVLKCKVAKIAAELTQLVVVALHTRATLMQGLVTVLIRQYDVAIKDGLRCLEDEMTVKKIRRRVSSFTASTIKASASSLVFSGDLRGTVMALDFSKSEERVRSRFIARPEEIMLVEHSAASNSSRPRNSFGLDADFSRQMLEIEADPNFSPALALSFHELVSSTPRISYISNESARMLRRPRRKKMHDEQTEIKLETLRNWTSNTSDILRRLPCNRKPRADLSIIDSAKDFLEPYRLSWEQLGFLCVSPEEVKRSAVVGEEMRDHLEERAVQRVLPLANDPWPDDLRGISELPEIPPNLPLESPKMVYSPIGIDANVVRSFFEDAEQTFDFASATSAYTRSETACLFMQLMLKSALEEVLVTQRAPFGPILVQVVAKSS
jgi:hypothetical protein